MKPASPARRVILPAAAAILVAAGAFYAGRFFPFERESGGEGKKVFSQIAPAPKRIPAPADDQAGGRAHPQALKAPPRSEPNELTALLNRIQLFDSSGILSQAVIRKLQLTDEEQKAVQKRIFQLHRDMDALAKKHLKKDPLRTNESTGVTAWVIGSFSDEGERALSGFVQSSKELLGEERGGEIGKMYPSSSYYGGFGKNDVVITFKSEVTEVDGSSRLPCEIVEYDPGTGKKIGGTYGDFSSLKQFYGDVFAVQEPPPGK